MDSTGKAQGENTDYAERVLSWREGVSRLVRMKKPSLGAYQSRRYVVLDVYTVYGGEADAELKAKGRRDE